MAARPAPAVLQRESEERMRTNREHRTCSRTPRCPPGLPALSAVLISHSSHPGAPAAQRRTYSRTGNRTIAGGGVSKVSSSLLRSCGWDLHKWNLNRNPPTHSFLKSQFPKVTLSERGDAKTPKLHQVFQIQLENLLCWRTNPSSPCYRELFYCGTFINNIYIRFVYLIQNHLVNFLVIFYLIKSHFKSF